MSEEEIKALLAEQLVSMTDLLHKSISGAMARSQSDTDKKFAALKTVEPIEPESSLELKSLQAKFAELEKARAEDIASAKSTQRDNAILSELGSRKLVAPNSLKKLLAAQYGSQLEQENGKWFVKEGDSAQPFESIVDNFLSSEDGKVFVPPSSSVIGNGSKAGNVQKQTEQKQNLASLMEKALEG